MVSRQWPHGGPWIVVPTAAAVDWEAAVAVLAASASVRVAAVTIGADPAPGTRARTHVATWIDLRDSGDAPLTVKETFTLVSTLTATHGLVLVTGVPGLLVPIGRAGWTMTDLAAALGAPAVVITGEGPDAANHTTLALGSLTAHGLAGAVVTIATASPPPVTSTTGDGAPMNPSDATGIDLAGIPPAATAVPRLPGEIDAQAEAAREAEAVPPRPVPHTGTADDALTDRLPVSPAGRIPAGVDPAALDRETARRFLDPILHASDGSAATTPDPKASTPAAPTPAASTPAVPVTSGTKVVLALGALFVTMSLGAVGLAFCHRPEARPSTVESITEPEMPEPVVVRTDAPRNVPVAQVCPTGRLPGEPTRPAADVTARVDDAWERIETWLAAKAPASRDSLRPGARLADIDAAQRHMSVPFPPDLVASLLRHDGADSGFPLPFMHHPMPVAEMTGDWQMLCGVLANSYVPGDDSWWDGEYIPIARAGDGGYLLVDQRQPTRTGKVGEFYNEDGVRFSGWPPNVAELLERTATSLETGEPFAGRYRPVLTGDHLEWLPR